MCYPRYQFPHHRQTFLLPIYVNALPQQCFHKGVIWQFSMSFTYLSLPNTLYITYGPRVCSLCECLNFLLIRYIEYMYIKAIYWTRVRQVEFPFWDCANHIHHPLRKTRYRRNASDRHKSNARYNVYGYCVSAVVI